MFNPADYLGPVGVASLGLTGTVVLWIKNIKDNAQAKLDAQTTASQIKKDADERFCLLENNLTKCNEEHAKATQSIIELTKESSFMKGQLAVLENQTSNKLINVHELASALSTVMTKGT